MKEWRMAYLKSVASHPRNVDMINAMFNLDAAWCVMVNALYHGLMLDRGAKHPMREATEHSLEDALDGLTIAWGWLTEVTQTHEYKGEETGWLECIERYPLPHISDLIDECRREARSLWLQALHDGRCTTTLLD